MHLDQESNPGLHDADESGSIRFGQAPWMIAPNDIKHFRMPVYAHFGNGPFHVAGSTGEWNMEGLMAEYGAFLARSRSNLVRRPRGADKVCHKALLFHCREDVFVFCDGTELMVYAADRAQAEYKLRHLVRRYGARPRKRDEACFKILEVFMRSIETQDVAVPLSMRYSQRDLALHYGEEFPEWERWFTARLRRARNSISVFQGEPGTGKTSFLRHLIVRMRRTHRFYFVPPNEVAYLLRTSALGFWMSESKQASKLPPVMIIEDAEKAVLRRASDNHQDVSSILNIADGLLGHCVRAHIICTVNCADGDIDPAVTRPGRMAAWRTFRRLTSEEGARLAKRKGLVLPGRDQHTLAEIYHGSEPQAPGVRPIRRAGFGAACEPVARPETEAA